MCYKQVCWKNSVIPASWEAKPFNALGAVAQLGERRFCKAEAIGSIPISSM